MSDWLEKIKKKLFQRPIQTITDDDIQRLIAGVERLRSVGNSEFEREAWFKKRLQHEKNLKNRIESLTKELGELKRENAEWVETGNELQKRLGILTLQLATSEKARLDAEERLRNWTGASKTLTVETKGEYKLHGKVPKK